MEITVKRDIGLLKDGTAIQFRFIEHVGEKNKYAAQVSAFILPIGDKRDGKYSEIYLKNPVLVDWNDSRHCYPDKFYRLSGEEVTEEEFYQIPRHPKCYYRPGYEGDGRFCDKCGRNNRENNLALRVIPDKKDKFGLSLWMCPDCSE